MAAIIVSVIVGGFIWYAVGTHNSDNSHYNKNTYYYYIDYGPYETSTTQNGWIYAQAYYPDSGLLAALNGKGT